MLTMLVLDKKYFSRKFCVRYQEKALLRYDIYFLFGLRLKCHDIETHDSRVEYAQLNFDEPAIGM